MRDARPRSTGRSPSGSPSGRRAEPFCRLVPRRLARTRLRGGHRRGRGASWPRRTGLVAPRRPRPARVTDRPAGSRPTSPPSSACSARSPTSSGAAWAAGPGPSPGPVAGAEVGMLLGWMSTRVLGQYDLLVDRGRAPRRPGPRLLRGPNVLGLEKRFAFPPKEFRLWLALHEVTHRAQFTGVPWLRPTSSAWSSRRSTRSTPTRSGSSTPRAGGRGPAHRPQPARRRRPRHLLATPAQADALDKIGGLMSLLEGHGDVTMDRAGADRSRSPTGSAGSSASAGQGQPGHASCSSSSSASRPSSTSTSRASGSSPRSRRPGARRLARPRLRAPGQPADARRDPGPGRVARPGRLSRMCGEPSGAGPWDP